MSDRVSASTEGDSTEGEGLHSPKKLQRSIWNQIAEVPSLTSHQPHLNCSSSLSLRSINLTPSLPVILHQCKPHASHITSLDVSYSILDESNISALCAAFSKLQSFCAVDCGLEELEPDMMWPRGLKRINLSRNRLTDFPTGIGHLLYLEELNVSGNRIHTVNLAVLQLPILQILHLLNNPIHNVPKQVCREGVCEMRRYFNIEPLPLPIEEQEKFMQSQSKINSLSFKNLLLQYKHRHMWSESTESGYNSPSQRMFSSCSSLTDQEEDEDLNSQLPVFNPNALPEGYTQACNSPLCQVYLPTDCGQNVSIEIVKDFSLHPKVCPNKLLVTPVVRIAPHGLMFPSDRPAIVVLSHCTWPNSQEVIVPMCSNTGLYEPPRWTKLEPGCYCEVFRDCVTFSTTHFSLFAAVSILPYPSTKADINNEGGVLTLPELPGFQIHVPPGSVHTDIPITVQATVYYADYIKSDHNLSLATACVGLEPHGMEFRTLVFVSIPIPDFAAIKASFQDAQLQLWTSPYIDEHTLHWEHVLNADISVQEGASGHIATFQVNHFSFFELLWTICRDTLQTLGYGASFVYRHLPSRTRYVSIRCQVFMSQPLDDQTFGLLVAVYKFGEPLTTLSNYKWMLADTGSKHMFLKTGELRVSLEGCFEPRRDVGETVLSRRAEIQFVGEDFCRRFEFALRLRDVLFPLVDHQVIGKLYIRQWDGTTPVELNLIKPTEGSTFVTQTPETTPTVLKQAEQFMDFTPPWSPDSDVISYQDSPTHTHHHDHNTPTRQGKHRRTLYLDPPDSGVAKGVKRRLLVREGQIGDKSDRFLMEVARSVGPKWEEVGVALGLDFDTVTSVIGSREGGASEHLKAFHMLQEWKRRAALDFTFTRLATALEEVGLNSCAQRHCYIEQHSENED